MRRLKNKYKMFSKIDLKNSYDQFVYIVKIFVYKFYVKNKYKII